MPGGRPPIFTDPKEMDRLVDEYVALRREEKRPVLLTGMILHLGLSSRQSLDHYANRPEFSDSVKRAKMIIEAEYEENLHGTASTGSIFALKNFGWKDKQETELSGELKTDNVFTVKVVGD